jgi:hypothetical protein
MPLLVLLTDPLRYCTPPVIKLPWLGWVWASGQVYLSSLNVQIPPVIQLLPPPASGRSDFMMFCSMSRFPPVINPLAYLRQVEGITFNNRGGSVSATGTNGKSSTTTSTGGSVAICPSSATCTSHTTNTTSTTSTPSTIGAASATSNTSTSTSTSTKFQQQQTTTQKTTNSTFDTPKCVFYHIYLLVMFV